MFHIPSWKPKYQQLSASEQKMVNPKGQNFILFKDLAEHLRSLFDLWSLLLSLASISGSKRDFNGFPFDWFRLMSFLNYGPYSLNTTLVIRFRYNIVVVFVSAAKKVDWVKAAFYFSASSIWSSYFGRTDKCLFLYIFNDSFFVNKTWVTCKKKRSIV